MQKTLASFFTKGADKKAPAAGAGSASPEGDPVADVPKENGARSLSSLCSTHPFSLAPAPVSTDDAPPLSQEALQRPRSFLTTVPFRPSLPAPRASPAPGKKRGSSPQPAAGGDGKKVRPVARCASALEASPRLTVAPLLHSQFKRLRKPAAAEDAVAKDMETDLAEADVVEAAAEAAPAPSVASPAKAAASPTAKASAPAAEAPAATKPPLASIFNKPAAKSPAKKAAAEKPAAAKAKGKGAAGAASKAKGKKPEPAAAAAAADDEEYKAEEEKDEVEDAESEEEELEEEEEEAAPAAKAKKAAGAPSPGIEPPAAFRSSSSRRMRNPCALFEPWERIAHGNTCVALRFSLRRLPSPSGKSGKKGAGASAAGVGDKARATAATHRDYDPLAATAIEGATWQAGKPVPFLYLARTFEAISETTKRLEIQTLLCNCFRTIIATTPEDLLPAVYLSSSAVRLKALRWDD